MCAFIFLGSLLFVLQNSVFLTIVNVSFFTHESKSQMASNENDTPVTRRDLEQALEKFGENFATKDDLKNFATKDDLAEVKQDIVGIKKDIELLAIQVTENQTDIREMKADIREMKTDFRQALNSLDRVIQEYSDYSIEKAATHHALKRQDNRLEDHELRITALEEKKS
jgi:chromosome segregation ATPase